ncbi:uncharacterized protein SPPG_02722 [Spizellomyces punctatus DAOM BR117]|uniref:Glycoside hydrolase 131 catalytic N-terminal domain-containing protein n=1 Tax=Spizellomyces punctatus (strain DAOM BR117) TaxID=645134 RepID=A0A0L0HLD1_SPIPD|nr:uncharacterized protein SPPG_02722 [Spizellomyces punctatus DAOM BR117]KND02241.1 hypothetical protein SPPG_02722 [Spizellomyces punctatus DAOM BR117]|eukprot:XP_016610280.1 hypothetical protein SPPG_02722 [Spizellomyces punctatus DAOM BR117]
MVAISRIALLSLLLGSALARPANPMNQFNNTELANNNGTQYHNGTQYSDDKEDDKHPKRSLTFTETPKKFSVRSNLANTKSFSYSMSTSGFPRIRTFMFDKDTDGDSQFKYTFMVGLLRVVEVNDTITWRHSQSAIDLAGQHWSPLERSTKSVSLPSGQNATLNEISTTYSDPSGALVTLSTFIAANNLTVPGTKSQMRPNQVKYGLEVENFPYIYQNSTLAIIKVIYSKSECQQDGDQISLGATGAFSWNSTLDVFKNNSRFPGSVVAAPLTMALSNDSFARAPEDSDGHGGDPTGGMETAKLIVFKVTSLDDSHVHASKVAWDPEITVDSAYTSDAALLSNSAMRNGKQVLGMSVAFAAMAAILMI